MDKQITQETVEIGGCWKSDNLVKLKIWESIECLKLRIQLFLSNFGEILHKNKTPLSQLS